MTMEEVSRSTMKGMTKVESQRCIVEKLNQDESLTWFDGFSGRVYHVWSGIEIWLSYSLVEKTIKESGATRVSLTEAFTPENLSSTLWRGTLASRNSRDRRTRHTRKGNPVRCLNCRMEFTWVALTRWLSVASNARRVEKPFICWWGSAPLHVPSLGSQLLRPFWISSFCIVKVCTVLICCIQSFVRSRAPKHWSYQTKFDTVARWLHVVCLVSEEVDIVVKPLGLWKKAGHHWSRTVAVDWFQPSWKLGYDDFKN